jgi:hypothetical protein
MSAEGGSERWYRDQEPIRSVTRASQGLKLENHRAGTVRVATGAAASPECGAKIQAMHGGKPGNLVEIDSLGVHSPRSGLKVIRGLQVVPRRDVGEFTLAPKPRPRFYAPPYTASHSTGAVDGGSVVAEEIGTDPNSALCSCSCCPMGSAKLNDALDRIRTCGRFSLPVVRLDETLYMAFGLC